MTIADLLDIANGGGIAFWVLATFALWRGWVVPRSVHRAEIRQRIFWQKTAWVALGLAKQSAPEVPDFDWEPEPDA